MSAPHPGPDQPSSVPEQTTLVGHFLGPHGVAGGVKLYVVGSAQQLSKLKRLYVGGLGWIRVQKFELHGAGPVLTLGGVSDRSAAEALHGRQVYAHDQELPALPEGEYYYHELRGLPLRSAAGELLGEVVDVQDAGHQDLLVVRGLREQRGLIPLQAPYVEVRRGTAIVLSEDAPLGLLGEDTGEADDPQAGDPQTDDLQP